MGNEPETRLVAVPAGPRPWWGGRRGRVIAGGAAVVVATVVLVSTFGLLGHPAGTTAQAAGEIYLAPASAVGANPFTASVMVGQAIAPPATAPPAPAEAPPPPVADAQTPAADQQQAPPPPPPPAETPPVAAATVDAAPPTAITTVSGSVPQLYGGTVGSGACDPQRLADLLAAAPDVAADWAFAQGIDAAAVHDFIQGLAPVLLLDDARVTDWGRVDGRAVPRQTVLEDGTAVLVDSFGTPRVRCLSGDPLSAPEVVRKGSRFVGSPWPRFRPANLVVIVPAPAPLPQVVLLDTGSGQAFARPLGGTGRSDVAPDVFAADLQAKAAAAGGGQQATDQPSQAQPGSAVQEASISPSGGPPGASVVASGTGWPAGDRIVIEPCVGSRPETCALMSNLAVFATADAGGAFSGVRLRVPATVSPSDYVEFYLRDVKPGQKPYSFDVPWSVSGAACDQDCLAPSGCHPPYCDPAGKRGCRCISRAESVCALDSCDTCPPSRCQRGVTALATPHATQTPRPPPTDTPSPRQSPQQLRGAPGSPPGSGPSTGRGTTSSSTATGTRTGTPSTGTGSPSTGTTGSTTTGTASSAQSRSTATGTASSAQSRSTTTGTASSTQSRSTTTGTASTSQSRSTATGTASTSQSRSTATPGPSASTSQSRSTATPGPSASTGTQPSRTSPTATLQPATAQSKPSQQSTPPPAPSGQGGKPNPGPSPTP